MNLSIDPSPIQREQLAALPNQLAGHRVLVVGDLVLDRYLIGRPTRLSREAPIPVLEFERRLDIPGSAANPAMNIQALGSQAIAAGIIGDDEAGRLLLARLQGDGIDSSAVVVDPARPTTTKTRVLADHGLRVQQQVARIDQVDRSPLASGALEKLVDGMSRAAAAGASAVLVSDYKSGLVSKEIIAHCRKLAAKHRLLLVVDSQGDLTNFAGFDLVKANREDTEVLLGHSLSSESEFQQAIPSLAGRLGSALVVTRGQDGLSVVAGGEYVHIPVVDRSEVFDVTGAGDTVIAVLALALASGVGLREAAHLANFAAGLVVRRLGNATVTPAELAEAVASSALWE
jgi:D-glycero-beta-D-manno-heptose-7-phosphate kinase